MVKARDLDACRRVERELADLCRSSARIFAAVNKAAHDQNRLEAMNPGVPARAAWACDCDTCDTRLSACYPRTPAKLKICNI